MESCVRGARGGALAEIVRLRELRFAPAVVDAFQVLDARELAAWRRQPAY